MLVNVPLYPQHFEMIFDALPLAPGVADALAGAVRGVLRYASIPLYGFLLILAGCIRFVRVPRPSPAGPSPAGSGAGSGTRTDD